jgi:glycosyltransferase involved in cell wall biosynthesis
MTGALKTGFAAATKDLVLYMDADLPFDPDVLGRAMRAIEVTGADMIAGYRLDRTLEGPRRTLYSYIYNGLIGMLFGWPHRDINFSFKLMKREVLEAVELKSEGSLIDAELIVKAKNRGFTIQQIGLDYFPRIRGQSHLGSPRVILKILVELVKLYPEMRERVSHEEVQQVVRKKREAAAGVLTDDRHPIET